MLHVIVCILLGIIHFSFPTNVQVCDVPVRPTDVCGELLKRTTLPNLFKLQWLGQCAVNMTLATQRLTPLLTHIPRMTLWVARTLSAAYIDPIFGT